MFVPLAPGRKPTLRTRLRGGWTASERVCSNDHCSWKSHVWFCASNCRRKIFCSARPCRVKNVFSSKGGSSSRQNSGSPT